MNTVTLGGLPFVLRRSPRRQTVGILVERDGSLILAAPQDTPLEALGRVVEQKKQWIYDRLNDKEATLRPVAPKEYVSGEGFYYLGRSYRLQVLDGEATQMPLRLYRGRFELRRDAQYQGRERFIRWYTIQLEHRLPGQIASLAQRLGLDLPSFRVRDLGYRWGSRGHKGELYFHWRLTMLPLRATEYVVAHEMVHLIERRHAATFWERLERLVPDYREYSGWLAEHGAQYDL